VVLNSHGGRLLLGEDPDDEVGLVVRLEGGGHQQVLPRRQREALRDFAHVDVRPAARFGRVVAEEVFSQLVLVLWSLDVTYLYIYIYIYILISRRG